MTDSQPSEAIAQFMELTTALDQDATSLLTRAKEDPDATARRSAVRAAFAAIEGLVFATKGLILEPFPQGRHHYSDAEVALLREETYALSNKGEATVQTRFLRLEDNLRFMWKMFVKEWGIDPEIDFESDGWKSFCRSIKVRNRITHPRRAEDLSVSDIEIAQVEQSYHFVYNMTMRNIFRALRAARHRDYEWMDRVLHPRVLEWLDALKRAEPPGARQLTSEESAKLKEIEAGCGEDAILELREHGLISGADGAFTLLQGGANYRDWRLKRHASAT